ncbi:hypothetical protein MGAST_12420 [Mycobacterium gastri 'Wayne']|nr:hypothetical protein MGAST_12420 [Mycobacterium gastri 'Wayne']
MRQDLRFSHIMDGSGNRIRLGWIIRIGIYEVAILVFE